VAAANVLDRAGGLGDPVLRTATAIWYAANEAVSITENAGEAGVPIPARLREAIARLKGEGET
jgi:phage-related holin